MTRNFCAALCGAPGDGAVVYLLVAYRRSPFDDVSGEPIAVASTHH